MNLLAESSTSTESHLGPNAVIENGRTLFLPNFPTQWREVPVSEPEKI